MVTMLLFLLLLLSLPPALSWFPHKDNIPDYCSHHPHMLSREIPPLSPSEKARIHQLLQVQVVIRHGARTPYMKYSCWNDYNIEWDNCNVTELMHTSSSPEEGATTVNNWLFRKVYDGSPNFLGGHCKTGQLLEEGFQQESTNGLILRRAYIGPDKSNLLKSHEWEENDIGRFYFRSDDEQRTLMSGQTLVHALFDIEEQEVITWHTGDYQLDTIYPNHFVCPRLDNISTDAFASDGYLNSPIQLNKNNLEEKINMLFGDGTWHWKYMIDCLMTTVCTGHDIPGDVSTASGPKMTNVFFNELVAYQEFDFYYKYTFQDAFYSKLAMTNMAYSIRSRVETVIKGDPKALQFVLYSGHDTTIMPLLAVLPIEGGWDGKWAPYGAMLTLELYRAADENTKFLFRLIYNGVPLVLQPCTTALCDVKVLLKALEFGQDGVPSECQIPVLDGTVDNEASQDINSRNILVYSVLLSASLSGLCTAACMYFLFNKPGGGSGTKYTRIDTSISSSDL